LCPCVSVPTTTVRHSSSRESRERTGSDATELAPLEREAAELAPRCEASKFAPVKSEAADFAPVKSEVTELAPVKKPTQVTRSPSRALSPPLGVVMPVSNYRPLAFFVCRPPSSTEIV